MTLMTLTVSWTNTDLGIEGFSRGVPPGLGLRPEPAKL